MKTKGKRIFLVYEKTIYEPQYIGAYDDYGVALRLVAERSLEQVHRRYEGNAPTLNLYIDEVMYYETDVDN